MADIAALGFAIDTSSVKEGNVDLQAMTGFASASEKAAQRWGVATDAAAKSAEDFSKRVRNVIGSLEFERAQLTRNTAEREKANALRRAGVSDASQEGRAIMASVGALQAQRSALNSTGVGYSLLGVAIERLAAAYGAAFIARKIFEATKAAGELIDTAEQIGVTVEGLQALRYQAIQSGIGMEDLDSNIAKMTRTMGEAGQGNATAIQSFANLGVKLLDLKGKMRPTQDVLVEVARAITGIEDPAARAAAAVDVFGKGGQRMLPMLAQLSAGFGQLQALSAKGIVPEDAAVKINLFANAMSTWWAEQMANLAKIGAAGVDAFNWLKDLSASLPTYQTIFENLWDSIIDGLTSVKTAGLQFVAGISEAFSQIATVIERAFANGMNAAIGVVQTGLTFIVDAINNALSGLREMAGQIPGVKAGTSLALPQRIVPTPQLGTVPGGGSLPNIADMAAAIAAAQAGVTPSPGMSAADQRQAARLGAAMAAAGGISTSGTPKPITTGAGMPAVKASGGGGGGGQDPYKQAIQNAKEYVAAKQAETAAVGQSLQVAAQMKHEQELLNKATTDSKSVTDAQRQTIHQLSIDMAAADESLAHAKFADEAKTKSEEFVAAQQAERDMLFMSSEAADAYRIVIEGMNDAKRKGIVLTTQDIDVLKQQAAAQASAKHATEQTTEIVNLGREVFQGFFSDMRQGLMNGQSLWEAFGNAAVNALNRIAEKLIEMAAKQLFDSALGGVGGAGGGWLGSLLGIGGQEAGAGIAGMADVADWGALPWFGFANGAAFQGGRVIPFAGGGVVTRPTLFPMANGMGLMGERGAEAVMPLALGPGGRLGVHAFGGAQTSGQAQPQQLLVRVELNTPLFTATVGDVADQRIATASPKIEGRAVKRAGDQVVPIVNRNQNERMGDWRDGR